MNQDKLIIFDLDNTLYDFDHHWENGHTQVFQQLKLDNEIDYHLFMEIYRKEDNKLWQQLNKDEITLSELRAYRPINTLKCFGKNLSYRGGEAFYALMFKYLISDIQIDKEINKLLEKLSAVYKLAILTNGFAKEQKMKIKKLDIVDYFTNIYISENIGIEKPMLEAFQKVLANESVLPKNTLMVGDSLRNDIMPAKRLGINTLHLSYSELKIYEFSEILKGN